jgi:hypothetical protein
MRECGGVVEAAEVREVGEAMGSGLADGGAQ